MTGMLKYSVLKVSPSVHSQTKSSHKGVNAFRSSSFKYGDKQGEYGHWSAVISHLSLPKFTTC